VADYVNALAVAQRTQSAHMHPARPPARAPARVPARVNTRAMGRASAEHD
jgi:hypothetical protein